MLGRCCSWMRFRDLSDIDNPLERVEVAPAGFVGIAPPKPARVEPAAASAPPASGAIPNSPSSFLLDTLLMALSPFALSLLRYDDVVAFRLNVPKSHHGVVFVHDIVAVDGILAQPVTEAEEELRSLVGMQLRDVLAA